MAEIIMTKLDRHLGGHFNVTHLDRGLLQWAKERWGVRSMLDIGCGPGGMVELSNSMGIDSLGVDGDFTIKRYDDSKFILHDFAKSRLELDRKFDLAWCCEFVEHVHAKYIPNFMNCFQNCRIAFVTYAPPGWGGHHHVNEQNEDYWIDVFAEYGMTHDRELSDELRSISTMNIDKPQRKQFMKNRGLFFRNNLAVT
jgi:SAM-dependent methyltransferase